MHPRERLDYSTLRSGLPGPGFPSPLQSQSEKARSWAMSMGTRMALCGVGRSTRATLPPLPRSIFSSTESFSHASAQISREMTWLNNTELGSAGLSGSFRRSSPMARLGA